MANTFSKVFLPIFILILLLPVAALCIYPRIRHRRRKRNCNRSNAFELTYVSATSANIDRLSASCFPPHPIVRPFTSVPLSARSARRRERLSRELQNPFVDPPSQNYSVASQHHPSVATFHTRSAVSLHTTLTDDLSNHAVAGYSPLADDNRPHRNFSTPTRQNRFSSSNQYLPPSSAVRSTAPPEPNDSATPIPVPERAFIRAVKPAGRAPPLYSTLAKFPTPPTAPVPMLLAQSSSSHIHLHPNKLFQTLSSMAQTPTPARAPTATSTTNTATNSSQPVSPIVPTSSPTKHGSHANDGIPSSPISSLHSDKSSHRSPAEESDPTPALTIKKRRGSTATKPKPNLSFTISPPSSSSASNHLTSTGAKTPVSAIREMFDRKASDPIFPATSIPAVATAVPAAAAAVATPALAVPTGHHKYRASSIYSRDSAGVPVATLPPRSESVSSLESGGNVKVAKKPLGKAPGGAEWI